MRQCYLRHSEESLGEGNNVLHLPNGVDAVLHGLGVFSARALKNAFDALNVALSPFTVRLPDDLRNANRSVHPPLTCPPQLYTPCRGK